MTSFGVGPAAIRAARILWLTRAHRSSSDGFFDPKTVPLTEVPTLRFGKPVAKPPTTNRWRKLSLNHDPMATRQIGLARQSGSHGFMEEDEAMIRLFMVCVAAAVMLGSHGSRAEFQMAGQTEGTSQNSARAEPADVPLRQRRPVVPQRVGPALASGFGHQVTLSFAVRQVVPKGIAVTFSGDLEPDTVMVDWRGGRPWPDVVRGLVRQSGLQVAFRPGAVLITRPPT